MENSYCIQAAYSIFYICTSMNLHVGPYWFYAIVQLTDLHWNVVHG